MPLNNFSLSNESFVQNDNDKDTIYQNIENLHTVNEKILSFEDLLFKDSNIYMVDFIDGKQLYEVLYSGHDEFNHDYKTILSNIIDRSKDLDNQEYYKVGLNKINGDLIYLESDLMNYYYRITEEQSNEEDFFNHIKQYFKKIVFHDGIKESLKTLDGDGLEAFSRDIVKSLICLEHELKNIIEVNHNVLPKSLEVFSSTLGLETSMEGNKDRKADFTFTFKKDNGDEIEICCEPHIKLSQSSKSGDNTYYFNRIYFHTGHNDIKDNKILIGHIGKHL